MSKQTKDHSEMEELAHELNDVLRKINNGEISMSKADVMLRLIREIRNITKLQIEYEKLKRKSDIRIGFLEK